MALQLFCLVKTWPKEGPELQLSWQPVQVEPWRLRSNSYLHIKGNMWVKDHGNGNWKGSAPGRGFRSGAWVSHRLLPVFLHRGPVSGQSFPESGCFQCQQCFHSCFHGHFPCHSVPLLPRKDFRYDLFFAEHA